MKLFLVSPAARSVEKIEGLLTVNFSNNHIVLPNRESLAWIVALAPDKTSAWLSAELGMASETNPNSGLVVEINTYYGCDSPALWQQLETWRSL